MSRSIKCDICGSEIYPKYPIPDLVFYPVLRTASGMGITFKVTVDVKILAERQFRTFGDSSFPIEDACPECRAKAFDQFIHDQVILSRLFPSRSSVPLAQCTCNLPRHEHFPPNGVCGFSSCGCVQVKEKL